MVVGVASTSALTTSELLNLLVQSGALTSSQLSAVQSIIGGTTAAATTGYVFNTNLTVGSRGADVTALQNAVGVSPATGYFGAITKAAVIQYQIAKGITPAAGYVGAVTRAALNAGSSVVIPGTPIPGNGVNITLAATSPMSGSIVEGQAAANLAEFTFTNTSATPAVVTNVTLARTGVSSDDTLKSVYLFDGVTRLTDSATVSSGKITFNAGAGLFTVAPGSSKTVSVKADIAASASGQLVGVSLTGVTSNVSVSASYPVSGANMNVFTATGLSTLTFGAVTSPVAVNSQTTLQAGTQNQTIWSSLMGVSQRGVNLRSIAFKVIGSIPTDSLQNIKLFAAGVQIGSASGIGANGMITFDLSSAPYKIETNRNIEVRADIVGGSARSFSVSLQNAADVQAVDVNYNVGVATASVPVSTGKIVVNATTGGYVIVTKDTSLSSGDVIQGASNVPLARYTFKAYGEDMKISDLYATSTVSLDNVALYANGAQIGSTKQVASSTLVQYSLGSSLVIAAGQSVTVEVRGDLKFQGQNVGTTTPVVVGIKGFSNNTQGSFAQQLSTTPSTEIDGPPMTVKTGSLGLDASAAVTSFTAVPNTSNQRIGSFVIQTTSAEAVRVTNLAVAVLGDVATTTNITNLRISDSTEVKGTPSTGANNFSVDFTVPANTTKTIDVFADLAAQTGTASTTITLSGYGVNSNTIISAGPKAGQVVTVGSGSLATPTLKTGSGYTPESQFVVGDTSDTFAYYNFKAASGPVTITELSFQATGTSVAAGQNPIVKVTVGGKDATPVAGKFALTGLNITVDNTLGGGYNLPVLVQYAKVTTAGNGGITSNNTAGLVLTESKYTTGNTTVASTSMSILSNLMTVVASKPTITVGNAAVTTPGTGLVEVARVTVLADAKGPVSLLKLPLRFSVSGANSSVLANSVIVKVGSTQVATTTNTLATSTASATTTVSFGEGYDIANSVTFSIWADISLADNGVIRTSIPDSSLFVWKDVNGNATSTGLLIKDFPTNSAVVQD
jgi:hypothetical protein